MVPRQNPCSRNDFGSAPSVRLARADRKVTDRRRKPSRRAATTAPWATYPAEPRVDVDYYHLRPLTKTFGGKGFEHCGEIAVGRRLHVDDTRIRRARQPGGGATL